MPYTVHDTPTIRATIDHDVARVTAVVRAGDAHLRSLVLTGGFARGEGAVLNGSPQNDYDFVAVRGVGKPSVPYRRMQRHLERELGLHIDLAPVPAWRLPFVARSIFWYETAHRGQVVWGDDVLGRIRLRGPADIARTEAMRLVVNRAAGLLLATGMPDPHARRIQAAKALLAAADARLLAAGVFAPSQLERQGEWQRLRAEGREPAGAAPHRAWTEWAFHYKVDPASAPYADAQLAWAAARRSLLAAVPVALRHAGLPDLAAYARQDGLADHAVYVARAPSVPRAPRFLVNPTGRVRLATLQLLETCENGEVTKQAARQCLGRPAERGDDPLAVLTALRAATLQ